MNDFKHYRVFTTPMSLLHTSAKRLNALGNKACVIYCETLPSDSQCLEQSLTLVETTCVFIAPRASNNNNQQNFDIAWYHNHQRIQRCGHGTLAAARYVKEKQNVKMPLVFHSSIEQLRVNSDQNQFVLHFDLIPLLETQTECFTNARRAAKTQSPDGYLLIDLGSESAVKDFTLEKSIIDFIKSRALIVTAISENFEYDIVFRYFAPQYGVLEDEATGSAGPNLWFFWQNHFNKPQIRCYQASANGGFFTLSQANEKIRVSGYVTEK